MKGAMSLCLIPFLHSETVSLFFCWFSKDDLQHNTMAAAPLPEAKPLLDPPTDGITALSYLPKSPSLLASTSWDGNVRIHDTASFNCSLNHSMDCGPLLSLATPPNDSVVTGGLNGSIVQLDVRTSKLTTIGRHTGEPSKVACSCLGAVDENTVVSAGWNSMLYLWDCRAPSLQTTIDLPGKAFGMDVYQDKVVVATSGRKNCIVDLTQQKVVLERESSLKYQSRCVAFLGDGSGFALGSIEGRVAVEFLEELGIPTDRKKYAFKCHRLHDTVYPVNAITFHPRFGTFCTGGCDGTVVTWDGRNKKKLTTLPKFATSVAALAFNHDGSELAVASSYTFEEGERDHPQDEIYVRKMLDTECQPKGQ